MSQLGQAVTKIKHNQSGKSNLENNEKCRPHERQESEDLGIPLIADLTLSLIFITSCFSLSIILCISVYVPIQQNVINAMSEKS